MRALHAIMAEPPFEIARNFLVLPEVMAVADRTHLLEIDPRPHNMDVLAAELLVHHNDARMSVEAELGLQRVDGLGALIVGQSVRRLGADGGGIERFLAPCADGVDIHLDQRAAQILRDGATCLDEADALVLLGIAEVRRELLRSGAGFALDDHGSRPSAFRIASRTEPRPASVCRSSHASTPLPKFTPRAIWLRLPPTWPISPRSGASSRRSTGGRRTWRGAGAPSTA